MNLTDLDDAAFELPTDQLIQPRYIQELQEFAAPAQAMERYDHAQIDPNLQQQQPPPGPHEDSPPELANDEMIQSILALAYDLGEYRDLLCYLFCRDSDDPVPDDDSDGENEDAVYTRIDFNAMLPPIIRGARRRSIDIGPHSATGHLLESKLRRPMPSN